MRLVDPTLDITDNWDVAQKILLVYEEYTELVGIQTALKKAGFDVLAISSEYTVSENILSFNPDILIGYGKGGKVSSMGIGRRAREMNRWQGKVILVLPAGFKPNPSDFAKVRADMLLEAPVTAVRLIQVISRIAGLDESVLLERMSKNNNTGDSQDQVTFTGPSEPNQDGGSIMVTGGPKNSEEKSFTGGAASVYDAKGLAKDDKKSTPEFVLPKNEEDISAAAFLKGPLRDRSGEQPTFSIGDAEPAQKKGKDPDLESLWDELVKGGKEETPAAPVSGPVKEEKAPAPAEPPQPVQPQPPKPMAFALPEREKEADHERVAKYARFTEQIRDFDPSKSHLRTETRKIQKDLTKTWNQDDIKNQDDLRREFTKALFRKK